MLSRIHEFYTIFAILIILQPDERLDINLLLSCPCEFDKFVVRGIHVAVLAHRLASLLCKSSLLFLCLSGFLGFFRVFLLDFLVGLINLRLELLRCNFAQIELLELLAVDGLNEKKCLCYSLESRIILNENLLSVCVASLKNIFDFFIYCGSNFVRIILLSCKVSSEENLVVIAICNRAELLTEAVLRNHSSCSLCCSLQVVACSCTYVVKLQFLGNSSSEKMLDAIKHVALCLEVDFLLR